MFRNDPFLRPMLDDTGSITVTFEPPTLPPVTYYPDFSDYSDYSDYSYYPDYSDYSKPMPETMPPPLAAAKKVAYDIYYEWIDSEQAWIKLNENDPDPEGLMPGKYDGQILAIKRYK